MGCESHVNAHAELRPGPTTKRFGHGVAVYVCAVGMALGVACQTRPTDPEVIGTPDVATTLDGGEPGAPASIDTSAAGDAEGAGGGGGSVDVVDVIDVVDVDDVVDVGDGGATGVAETGDGGADGATEVIALAPTTDPLWVDGGGLFAGGGWLVGWRPDGRGTLTVVRDGQRWAELTGWPGGGRKERRGVLKELEDACILVGIGAVRVEGQAVRIDLLRRPVDGRRRGVRRGTEEVCVPDSRVVGVEATDTTRILAGAALSGVEPLSALGFPAIAPDAMHVAVVEREGNGQGDWRLRVLRTDDHKPVVDEVLLSGHELAARRNEDVDARGRRLARLGAVRAPRVARLIERAGFVPMRAVQGAVASELVLPACVRKGPVPCYEDGCATAARVTGRWRGGDEAAGLGVEVTRSEPVGGGCGGLPVWRVRRLE